MTGSVVVVQGADLVRFLSRQEVQSALPVELQAEIGFGLHTSEVPADDLVLLAGSAIDQDTVWQQDAEPDIAERRRDAAKVAPADAANLGASAPREVLAWQQDWESAARAAVDVYEHLTDLNLRPYRALWAYLGSAWSTLAAARGEPGAAERAAQLLRTAHQAAAGTTWLREVQPLPSADPAHDPIDDDAVTTIQTSLSPTHRTTSKLS